MNPKRRILQRLNRATHILVAMHASPDGDTAGSALAIGMVLRALGRTVAWVSRNSLPERLAFLPHSQEIIPWEEALKGSWDLTVAVDCGSPGRLAAPEQFWTRPGPLVNIDHHVNNPEFGSVNWVDSHKSSTGEMIAELFDEAGWAMGADEALCLYVAISTDTLSFRQVNTAPSTLAVAHRLAQTGMDLKAANRLLWNSLPLGEVRLLGWALSHMTISGDGLIAWLTVSRSVMALYGVAETAVDTLVHHLLAIQSVEVAIVAREACDEALIKVSWRGKEPRDVASLATAFGGGGHRYAAAAQVAGSLDVVMDRVLGALGISP